MGRGFGRKFAQKRRERRDGDLKNVSQRPVVPYQAIVKENEKFIRYYREMKICSENEWDNFIQTLREDLPTTFRISASRNTAKKLLEMIQNEFFAKYISDSTREQKAPICLKW